MKVTDEIDVLIVGAGLVGLTLVNALRGSRLSVRLIDAQNEPKLAKTRPVSRQGGCFDRRCQSAGQCDQFSL